MAQKENQLVEHLISCLQDRKSQSQDQDRKLENVADLLEEPIDLEWENFYGRLRTGYRAIQKELQK